MYNHLLPHQFITHELRYKLGDYLSYGTVSGTIESIEEYKGGALITVDVKSMLL